MLGCRGWGFRIGLPVIGFAAFDGIDAVELFEEDDEGEFVLEGEGGEGEDEVALAAKFVGVAVGAADEKGDRLHVATEFEDVDAFDELGGGESFAAFVEGDAEGARALLEELFGLVLFLEVVDLQFAGAGEAPLVVGDAVGGVAEFWFADGEDAEFHGGEARQMAPD